MKKKGRPPELRGDQTSEQKRGCSGVNKQYRIITVYYALLLPIGHSCAISVVVIIQPFQGWDRSSILRWRILRAPTPSRPTSQPFQGRDRIPIIRWRILRAAPHAHAFAPHAFAPHEPTLPRLGPEFDSPMAHLARRAPRPRLRAPRSNPSKVACQCKLLLPCTCSQYLPLFTGCRHGERAERP